MRTRALSLTTTQLPAPPLSSFIKLFSMHLPESLDLMLFTLILRKRLILLIIEFFFVNCLLLALVGKSGSFSMCICLLILNVLLFTIVYPSFYLFFPASRRVVSLVHCFLLFTSMPNATNFSHTYLYADDTKYGKKLTNSDDSMLLQEDIANISDWSSANRLNLHADNLLLFIFVLPGLTQSVPLTT